MATARITSKGQITVPKEVRNRLGVEVGDELEFRFEDGRVEIRPVRRRRIEEFRGIFHVERALDFEEERRKAWDVQTERLILTDRHTDA